jgi:hypothetical protein
MDNKGPSREPHSVVIPAISILTLATPADNTQDSQSSLGSEAMALFRPPIHRSAAAVLDRALFSKTIPLAAARIADNKHISRYRTQLDKSRDLLHLERQLSVRPDPEPTLASKGGKCLLLQPEVKVDGEIRRIANYKLLANAVQIPQHGTPSYKKPSRQKSLVSFRTIYS